MLSQHLSSKEEMIYCCTGVKEDTFTYKWTIQNFEYCTQNTITLESVIYFSRKKSNSSSWYLKCQICTENRVKYIYVYLCLIDKKTVNAKPKLSILNSNGEKNNIYDRSHMHLFQPSGSLEIMRRNYDEFCKEENGNLYYGTLTLFCEVTIVDIVNKYDQFYPVKVPDCSLSTDLENVFEIKKFCDITLLVGGWEFKAHKIILSGRSNVFAAIFDNEFAESKQNCVTITDVDKEVFEELLRFMYTGRTKKIESMADKLLIAADKYALEGLKVLCEEVLSYKISIDNVCDFLVLADKHSANQLKVQTMEFIKNNFANVKSTVGWKRAKDSDPLVLIAIFEKSFEEISLG